jgi:UPF0755 protein
LRKPWSSTTANVVRWRQIERAKAAGDAAPVDRIEPPPESRTEGVPVGQAPATRASAFTASPGARPAGPNEPRPRGFDATEGTPRDPLLNRNYDLNTAKTVPSLRPLQ